jgi:hypothetical protein
MANPSVVIDIAAEYTGKKAFDKASKSTSALDKTVKNLAASLAAAFSVKAIVSFAKQAAKAAADDSKATAILAQNLKNIGLAYAEVPVESFIKQMQRQTGIVDDELRPAFSKLAQATMSVTKSQELMSLAFDVSKGSGVDFNTVVNTLSQAYLGNNKGLKKLNLQMTAAELKTASFAEIQAALNEQFKGSGKAALETYGGQLDILNTAAGEATETIGYALLDALKSLTGETDIDELAKDIDTAAGAAALFIKFTAKGVKPSMGVWGYWDSFVKSIPGYEQIVKDFADYLEVDLFPTGPLGNFQMSTGTILDQSATQLSKIEQERAKLERQRLAKEKALAAARLAALKKEALLKKQQAILSKAAAVFDLTKIQIAAALKGKISEEEKTRLLLMQAIEEENVDEAEKLIKKLEEIQAKNAKIAADLLAIGQAKDPFATWAGSLALAILELGKLGKGIKDIPGLVPGVNFNPAQNADRNYDTKAAAAAAALAAAAGGAGTGGGTSIFAEDDTIDEILAKVENAAAAAAEAAEAAAASVAETQVAVDALTQFGTNSMPAAGMNFNPYQNRDRNYDSGFSNAPAITINIEGNVLDGDDFTNKVNDALLNANRQGLPRIAAGSLVELP